MKLTALFFAILMVWGLKEVKAQDSVELTDSDKEVIALELQKEADSGDHDTKTQVFLKKVSVAFKNAKSKVENEVKDMDEAKSKSLLKKIGRTLGKGAAWVSTNTAKPFMTASAFVKGAVERGDKNKDIAALYTFFLNHQAEFDDLYLEAGTPEEMAELMLVKSEEIMQKKSYIIVKDFLAHLGITREIPQDLSQFELTSEEIESIDESKIDPAFINAHPEYQEVKALIGDFTKEEVMDLVSSGYFNKAISFENYKSAVPSIPELVATLAGQLMVPRIALGIISKTLASLYTTPVVIADIGTGVSTYICLQKETQEKFGNDKDLRLFCSYVTNKSAYELVKSRAKGYVSGKKFHQKVSDKIKAIREKRAKKKLNE